MAKRRAVGNSIIGWDIAIIFNGPRIFEGNCGPCDKAQAALRPGERMALQLARPGMGTDWAGPNSSVSEENIN